MKRSVKIIALFIVGCCLCTVGVDAQQTDKQIKKAAEAAAIKQHIEGKHYTFLAEYAQPMRGMQRYLTPDYDLRVTRDSVIAYLPYFGQVYMDAPMNPDEAGIMFTSTKFDYEVEQSKKGGWSILITLHDVKRSSKLRLDVFTNGTATLQVLSNTRDEITFTGHVPPPAPLKGENKQAD